MAYTTINKSTDYFNTKLYTGTGSSNAQTGIGHQPDLVWIKSRSAGWDHELYDAVRGVGKSISSVTTNAESNSPQGVTAFGSDGFTVGTRSGVNENNSTYASWNWKANGASPSQTYTVKVVSDSGNKYRFDDFGTSAVTLDLQEGGTYTFDQSDSSNSGHPLRFYTASDKSGGEYTTGVTTNGTPGSSGAYTRITVAASAPTLYYQCSSHAGMGGQANTNSLFGSSNFSGNIQSTVSANTTAGFSIVKWTGNGTNPSTVGHGLGVAPKMIIMKNTSSSSAGWYVYHVSNGASAYMRLNLTDAVTTSHDIFNDATPTSTVFSVNNDVINGSGNTIIAYCFAEKTGYSKFGKYTGNGNADGTFVYTGFKTDFLLIKRLTQESWVMTDSKRGYPQSWNYLLADASQSESSGLPYDFVSNGIKFRGTTQNENGSDYIYMAFGQTMVGSNDVPATAR